jgi:hypothetical protein
LDYLVRHVSLRLMSICVLLLTVGCTAFEARLLATPAGNVHNYAYLPSVMNASLQPVMIPQEADWTDHGIVLYASSSGWDQYIGAAIGGPTTVVKLDGKYFLYYIGYDGYRSSDGGARHRALGVATSDNGISNFIKYSGNPVIATPHTGRNEEEQGVFSAGATLDGDNNVILYWGKLVATGATTVSGQVQLASSSNGVDFTHQGTVLDETTVRFSCEDEVYPVGTYQYDAAWYVLIITASGCWDLGAAWGPSTTNLPDSRLGLNTNFQMIGGVPIFVATDQVAVFYVELGSPSVVHVRTVRADKPYELSDIHQSYHFSNLVTMTVFLDRDQQKWFMYYQTLNPWEQAIGVMTAPMVTQ